MHEYSRKLSLTKDPLTMTHLATSIDGMFCRKRGRPPKNRVIEVWNDCVSILKKFNFHFNNTLFLVIEPSRWSNTIGQPTSDFY